MNNEHMIKKNEMEQDELYILNQDLEWMSDGALYSVVKNVADGGMSISALRRHNKWHVVLRWLQRQVDTIEVIQTFEKAGLTLSDYQVEVLHEALLEKDFGNARAADDFFKKFFSSETKERIERLDLSEWDYQFLSTWGWIIDRPELQDGPEDSPSRVFLSKIKNRMVSKEPLEGEQKILQEMQEIMDPIGSLMKRIGASTWSEEELSDGIEAAA
jgi:hypothetical protein